MRACIDIAVADLSDDLRLGQIDEVVIALLIGIQPGLARIIFGREFRALDFGAVGAVLDKDAGLGGRFEFFAFGHDAAFGRRPSMWQMA